MTTQNTGRVRLTHLGCPKNLVDAEEMLGVLRRDGFELSGGTGDADVEVIHTCGFIEAAKQESIGAILEALERKKRGQTRRVIVTGCLAQRYGAELAAEMPEVDAFGGTGRSGQIASLIRDSLTAPAPLVRISSHPKHEWVSHLERERATPRWTAYLKISEGCDHQCTFCAIPSFRGAHTSKPFDSVFEEAERLVAGGAIELNLIAQDSTQYGYDLAGRCLLPELLGALSGIAGLKWIRVFYCYPSRVNGAVIEALATTPKVLPYIDMPLQHADDGVLKRMRRPGTGEGYLRLLGRIRGAMPQAAIRTTFIVGFPGETEEEFGSLLRFVEAARFDRVGVFEYSAEDGTPAGIMPGRIPARIKRSRRDRLMALQASISREIGESWIGQEMEVLVEAEAAYAQGDGPCRRGRSFRDAPEIDGQVMVRRCAAKPGEMVRARVTGASAHDLVSEYVVGPAAP